MAISRGQMYRQMYYGGGEGIASLDAGAPSIKYTGNINPQMASAPDIGATRNDAAMELFNKPLKDLTPEELELLDEILASQASGGIMNAVPREQALLGGIKKAVKKVTGGIKDIVKSDIGKAALAGAAIYGLGGGFGPARFSMSRLPGIGGFFAQSGAAPGSFRFAQDIGVKQGLIPNLLSKAGKALTSKEAMVGLGGAALSLLSGSGLSENEITELQRDPEALKGYLRSSYKRVNPDASDQEVETFVTENTREYKSYGGRISKARGDTAQMAAGIEGLPYRKNQAGVGEVDLRETGGFIPPVGVKEKADDIPAMLSNNEFVFTADAVRGMGDGDVNKGAQRMYDMMKTLENGGRV